MEDRAPSWDVPSTEKAGLKDSTEALIIAAPEQEVGTRSVESGVDHSRPSPSPALRTRV